MIAHHHNPSRRSLLRPKSVATVYAGDFIAHNLHIKEPDDIVAEDHLKTSMKLLNLTKEEIVDVVTSVSQEEDRIRETLALVT